jgi:hypothetical protein
MKRGDLMSKSLAANAGELPHLETQRTRFDGILVRVSDLAAQQVDLTARKQEITRQMAALLLEGRELLTFLKAGVRQHFGRRAEKLVAFGLQPFRSRARKAGPDGPPLKSPTAQEPPAPLPNQ